MCSRYGRHVGMCSWYLCLLVAVAHTVSSFVDGCAKIKNGFVTPTCGEWAQGGPRRCHGLQIAYLC